MKGWVCILCLLIAHLAQAAWENIRLTNNQFYSGEPKINTAGSRIGVAYEEYENGNDEIYLITSENNGATFSAPIRVSNNDSASWRPIIAVNDGYDIIWEDKRTGKREVYYKRYANSAFLPTVKISSGNVYSAFPSVTNDNNDLFVVWEDFRDGNDEIYFRKYVSGTWSSEKRLTANDSTSWGADIAFDTVTGDLHVVWFDFRTGNDEVYYISSNDKGETWSAPLNLSNDAPNSWEPRVAACNGRVGVVWYSWRADVSAYEVFFAEKSAGSWSSPMVLSNVGADSKLPSISMNQTGILVAWEDYQDNNDEIYIAFRAQDSVSWKTKRLTNQISDSFGASAALSSTEALISWFDYRDGVDQIYFAKGSVNDILVKEDVLSSRTGADLHIYPNPLNRSTRIMVRNCETRGVHCLLELYDIRGKLIRRHRERIVNLLRGIEWKTSDVPPGVYLMRAWLGKKMLKKRFIIIN